MLESDLEDEESKLFTPAKRRNDTVIKESRNQSKSRKDEMYHREIE